MEFVPDRAPQPQHTTPQRHLECEARPGGHRVTIRRQDWPPPPPPNEQPHLPANDRPNLRAVCQDCGVHVIVYDPPGPAVTIAFTGPGPLEPVGAGKGKA
jgi:hypothetical protein